MYIQLKNVDNTNTDIIKNAFFFWVNCTYQMQFEVYESNDNNQLKLVAFIK